MQKFTITYATFPKHISTSTTQSAPSKVHRMATHETHCSGPSPVYTDFGQFSGHVQTSTNFPVHSISDSWGSFTMLQNPYLPILAQKNFFRARPKIFEFLQIVKIFWNFFSTKFSKFPRILKILRRPHGPPRPRLKILQRLFKFLRAR